MKKREALYSGPILQDPDLEEALLACLLVDFGACWPRIERILPLEAFSREYHQKVYTTMMRLWEQHGALDYKLLSAELRDMELDDTKPIEWLASAYFHPFAKAYALKLFDLYQRRELLRVAGQGARAAHELPADKALDVTAAMVEDVLREQTGRLEEGADAWAELDEMEADASAMAQGEGRFWPTGIRCLDDWTYGMGRKKTWTIGAYTGVGKTWLGLHLALESARQSRKALYVTCEMPRVDILARMVGHLAVVDYRKACGRRLLTKDEYERWTRGRVEVKALMDAGLLIVLENSRTINLILGAVRAETPALVVVDYVQRIPGESGEREYSFVTRHSGMLQDMAIANNCCVVMLSQLSNEAAAGRLGPDMMGFKESGALGADADVALVLQRDKLEMPNLITFWVKKNRGGQDGINVVAVDLATGTYRDVMPEEREQWLRRRKAG